MKCKYHPTAEAGELCRTCNKALCSECAHTIKGKHYCQDCLVEGAEWASAVKELRIPADSPKRAAICSLIPGMGAVYNNEYLKAITYFAVFACLIMMADNIHGVFGFGSFAFIVFTMFDSYRTAEANARARIVSGGAKPNDDRPDKTIIGWGIFLMVLGMIFLLQNLIPYHFLNKMWPLMFILLGAYLVYRYARDRQEDGPVTPQPISETKQF
jgi:hypothetical protein